MTPAPPLVVQEQPAPGAALAEPMAAARVAVHRSGSNHHQPGTGHAPFDAVPATLRDAGSTGPLAVECRLRGEPADAAARCGAFSRGLLGGWS